MLTQCLEIQSDNSAKVTDTSGGRWCCCWIIEAGRCPDPHSAGFRSGGMPSGADRLISTHASKQIGPRGPTVCPKKGPNCPKSGQLGPGAQLSRPWLSGAQSNPWTLSKCKTDPHLTLEEVECHLDQIGSLLLWTFTHFDMFLWIRPDQIHVRFYNRPAARKGEGCHQVFGAMHCATIMMKPSNC